MTDLSLYGYKNPPAPLPLKSIDSVLCIAKPWMLCICYCTNSIKLHRPAFVRFRTVYSQAMDALHLLLYQIHQTPPAAFVGFRTVYSQAMDALHLLLYQIHQTPPAAFVGFRTVYSQVMDALHLLLYQIHQTPPAAFVRFRTVYSQAMDVVFFFF